MKELVTSIPKLHAGDRLLCGPGPSNVHPQVLEAMRQPINGHLDPDLWNVLLDLVEGLKALWRRLDGVSLCLSASGTSGMEAGIANLTEPGDKVIVIHAGFFGARIAEMARRAQTELVELTAPLGQIVPLDQVQEALKANHDTKLVGVVHAETSTGVRYPLEKLAHVIRATAPDALLLADCVTSLGGEPVETAAWDVDYAYSCSQKSLGCPPGLSPFSISERGLDRIRKRQHPVSFSFDIDLLAKYWLDRPAPYHHTMPILQYYALYEGIRLALEEGLEARWARHEDAGRYFQQQMRDRGYTFLSDPDHQLWELSAVNVPEDVDGKQVQSRFLRELGIEIGGGLGPGAPPIWRVGLMGVNANREAADRVLAAFDAVLPR
ncbi:MAG: aminotransferase class V-fold PLP-dependent enzyme [Actinobacteria bacterium]|nr:aminotransferase class V-fold PLP-dependent enzyme [Actinomycetota bacterium]